MLVPVPTLVVKVTLLYQLYEKPGIPPEAETETSPSLPKKQVAFIPLVDKIIGEGSDIVTLKFTIQLTASIHVKS